MVKTVTDAIGKKMSTKAVGSDSRQDITHEYKYPEKSVEDRASHGSAAAKQGGIARDTWKI